VKIKKHVRKTTDDDNIVKGNPGGNRTLAMVLDGKCPDESTLSVEDIEDGENDLINSHLLYDDYME